MVNAAERGHSVSAVLKREYYLTPFPESIIADTEFCKHISNAFELKKMAKQFQNCLADYCEEGIRGEYQYYRWYENNRPVAIVSLREDAPYGFRIFEIKGKRNEFIEDELELKILDHFADHGIFKMSSLEGLLNNLSGMFKNDHRANDPTDHINEFIDDLLDERNLI